MKKRFSNLRKLKVFQLNWWTDDYCFRLITILGAILLFPYLVSLVDFKPATFDDYAPLYEQAELVRQDFSNVTQLDNVSIFIKSTQCSIIAESDECTLTLYIDIVSNEILSISEVDKATPIWLLLIVLLFSGAASFGFAVLFVRIIYLICGYITKAFFSLKKRFSRY